MIDASTDQDYAAFERAQGQATARREERRERPARGTLAELAAHQPVAASPGALQVEDAATSSSSVAAEPPRDPADALASLRVARLGLAAAVVLAVVAIWARRRRNG